MVGEKPFESVERAFTDREEWKALMKFTDGTYLKVGGDCYSFSEFLARKMKKRKLLPEIVGNSLIPVSFSLSLFRSFLDSNHLYRVE